MPNTQTGPYPVLFAKNTTRARINLQATVGGTGFHSSLGPGEVASVPWVIAKSAGFHRLWGDGSLEVSDRFDFSTTLDELPAIGADDGPTNWDEIEGTPEAFPPAEHTRSWDEIDGKPSTFPPDTHNHSWGQVTGKPSAFPPETHTHAWGDITGKPTTFDPKIGTTATTAAAGNDPRLSDSRTPKTHSHAWADITDKPTIPPAAPVAAAQADSTAEDVAGLVADFNSLLAKLRTAGIIAT